MHECQLAKSTQQRSAKKIRKKEKNTFQSIINCAVQVQQLTPLHDQPVRALELQRMEHSRVNSKASL